MAKYTVNLDKVWNLPIGVGNWAHNGKYCALGLVAAGIFGETDLPNWGKDKFFHIINEFASANIFITIGCQFDSEIMRSAKDKHEAIREKYARKILEIGIEAGLFEVSDGDLEISREFSAISKKKLQEVK